jgi:hypothetical protein
VSDTVNSGIVSASILVGTLQTTTQPNITQVGTLGSLAVTNGITSSSVSTTTITTSTITGTLQTAAQPNVTSVGTLSSLIVSTSISANSVSAPSITGTLQTANQSNITTIGTLGSLNVTNAITGGSVSATTLTGTLQTASQTNITAIGTLSNLNVTNNITATSFYGTLQTASQPNITTIGTLSNLNITSKLGLGTTTGTYSIEIHPASNATFGVKLDDGTVNTILNLGQYGPVFSSSGTYLSLVNGLSLRFVGGGGIVGISDFTATNLTGTLQSESQPNITEVGILNNLNIDSYLGVGVEWSTNYQISVRNSNGKMISFTNDDITMILTTANGDYTINTSNNRLALGENVDFVLNNGTIIGLSTLTVDSIYGTIQTTSQPNITSIGTLSGLSVNGNSTVSGSSTMGSAHITGDVTIDGELILSQPLSFSNISASTITLDSNVNASSSTNGGTLTVTGGGSISKDLYVGGNLYLGNTILDPSAFSGLSNLTPGTVTNGKLLIADSSLNLSGFNNLTATNLSGVIQTAHQPNITTVGNLQDLNVLGYVGIGTTAPSAILEVNSANGSCLRLSYDNANVSGKYANLNVDSGGNLNISTTGGLVNIPTQTGNQLIIGNTSNNIMPLEIGYVSFVMTGAYAYNTSTNSKGTVTAGGTTAYNYSIRALGRILCTQSLDVTSDSRLKKDVKELSDEFCTSFIETTTPVSFNWKKGDDLRSYGYIAQDLLRNGFDDIVNLAQDPNVSEVIDDDGFISPEGIKFTISYQYVIPILAKNQKRLMKENKELKAMLENILAMLQRK